MTERQSTMPGADDEPTNRTDDDSFTRIVTRDRDADVVPLPEVAQVHEGMTLGEYVVGKALGGGGGGVVYAARHRTSGKRVAIKVLRSEVVSFPSMYARFAREAVAVSKIRHPNIIEIFEFNEIEPGRPYYVMELLEGIDLRKLLHLQGRFSCREALEIMDPVCRAVQAAHDAGIVHRDIKASNVVISEVGGARVVKLLDFGIAKMLHGDVGQGLTEPGVMLGTAHNMAPEQIRCERLDGRADIYALGVTLFQLLTGHYPFHSDDHRQIATMHLVVPPPRPSASAPVPPAVDAVILRCLEKHPDKRFASATELLDALSAAVGDVPPAPPVSSIRALGVYFEVTNGCGDDIDDDMIEDISNVLDMIEHRLTRSSFAFPLRTSSALLGVRPIASDVDKERAEAAAVVAALRTDLAARPMRHSQVDVAISLSVGEATCRACATGNEIVGGPLLEVGGWSQDSRVDG